MANTRGVGVRKSILTGAGLLMILNVCLSLQCSVWEQKTLKDHPDKGLDGGAMDACRADSREHLEDIFACVLKDSGLRVLVASLPKARNTSVRVVYGVGVGGEEPYESGAAHFLEHLLFHGTKKFPDPKKELRLIGASFNGSTGLDTTTYSTLSPTDDASVRLVLDIEMDRMFNAQIETLDIDAERGVVRRELVSTHNDLHAVLRRLVYETAFRKHGYGRRGREMENLSGLDVSEVENFYRRHYRPDNATVIVAGPVAADEVIGWVAQSLNRNAPPGPISTYDAPVGKEKRSAVAPLRRESRIIADEQVEHATIGVFFRSFPPTHPDFPAMVNLQDVLVSGREARLQKLLTVPGLAKRVAGSAMPHRDGGGLYIQVDPAPEQDPSAVRKILLKALFDLGSGKAPVSLEEAERARGLAAKSISSWKTKPNNVTGRLASSVAYGDWRYARAFPKAIAAVTADDLNRVAKNMLTDDRRTTVTLLPVQNPPSAAISQSAGFDTSWIDKFAPVSTRSAGGMAINATGSERPRDEIKILKKRFNDCWSMDAAVDTRHTQGTVVGALLVRLVPPAVDTSDVDLLLHTLLPDLLFGPEVIGKEAAVMGRFRLQQVEALDLENLMVSRMPGGWFRFDFSGELKDVATALKMLDAHARTLHRDSGMVRQITRQHIEAHAQQMKNIFMVGLDASLAFFDNGYDKDDLRRKVVPDLPASLKALTFEDVQAFAQRASLNKGHLVIAGNVEMSEIEAFMQTTVNTLSGRMPCNPAHTDKPRRLQALSKPVRKQIRVPDASETSVFVVNTTKQGLKETDLLAFELAGEILNSRIAQRLREQGLAYQHAAMFSPRPGTHGEHVAGIMSAAAVTTPDQVNRVAEIIQDELKTLRQQGVSVDELSGAKNDLAEFENHTGPLAYAVNFFASAYMRGATREESLLQWMRRNATMRERLTVKDVNAALGGSLADTASLTVVAGNL